MALVMDRFDPARIAAIQGAGETDECLEIQLGEDGSRNDWQLLIDHRWPQKSVTVELASLFQYP
jgi:hypothetical protein